MSRNSKVIGYFGYSSPTNVICTGESHACVIAGSEEYLRDYINEITPVGHSKVSIKKTRFGEILKGLYLGAAYAFDVESYTRFYPLARQEGLPVKEADFNNKDGNNRFFTVQLGS